MSDGDNEIVVSDLHRERDEEHAVGGEAVPDPFFAALPFIFHSPTASAFRFIIDLKSEQSSKPQKRRLLAAECCARGRKWHEATHRYLP